MRVSRSAEFDKRIGDLAPIEIKRAFIRRSVFLRLLCIENYGTEGSSGRRKRLHMTNAR